MSTWSINGGFLSVFDTVQSDTVTLASIKSKTDSLTFTVAGNVNANIHYVNDLLVGGSGTELDPWGP